MPDRSTLSILIVDDQASIRALLRASLQQLGFNNIAECGDGQEALKHSMRIEEVVSPLT